MKKFLAGILILIAAMLIFFFVLGYKSLTGSALGLLDNKLQSCPDTPNCVLSDNIIGAESYIEPLAMGDMSTEAAIEKISALILSSGGKIQTSEQHYIAATYRSSIFSFMDDLEIRVDSSAQNIHFRSASRVGKSDFGVNRARVEALKNSYSQ